MSILVRRVALVTGGSSGIGRAAALRFGRAGAKVVVAADASVQAGQETARMIEEAGGEAIFVQADVSNAAQVEALIEEAVGAYGRLDCALNNAGVYPAPTPTAELTEADWDRTIGTNLKGVWLCMKHEIQQMLRQGSGAIVNMASVAGLVGYPGPAYTASKHGVVGLTKAAALEYAKMNIRINTVCPGVIRTPPLERKIAESTDFDRRVVARHPIGRLGTPEEVAEAVVWLCSDAASFVTGHALTVDGGFLAQ
jgi:NAD(P)-dependent dehydrogenase (short-subunit alcohol dehydrogenase family)